MISRAPWTYRPTTFPGQVIMSAENGLVAILPDAKDKTWTVEDARLIAAAPDLVAVAEEFDRLALVIESAVREARSPHRHAAVLAALKANHAAIAKARGKL